MTDRYRMPCRGILLALLTAIFLIGCSDDSDDATTVEGSSTATQQTDAVEQTEANPGSSGATVATESSTTLPPPIAGEFSVLKIQEKNMPMGTGVARNVIAVIFSEPIDGRVDFRPHVSLTQLPTDDGNGGQRAAEVVEGDWVLTATEASGDSANSLSRAKSPEA